MIQEQRNLAASALRMQLSSCTKTRHGLQSRTLVCIEGEVKENTKDGSSISSGMEWLRLQHCLWVDRLPSDEALTYGLGSHGPW